MKQKAQGMLEYVVLLGVVALALTVMQLYFKRAIQATVKLAADEIGEQKKGVVEVDGGENSNTSTHTSTIGITKTTYTEGGAVSYETHEGTREFGVLYHQISPEEQ